MVRFFGPIELAMILGAILILAVLAAGVVFIILHGQRSRRESGQALEILNTRYARGEITKAEYDQMRRDIVG